MNIRLHNVVIPDQMNFCVVVFVVATFIFVSLFSCGWFCFIRNLNIRCREVVERDGRGSNKSEGDCIIEWDKISLNWTERRGV